ncbi:retrovirus-related pol polyprotein from transposon TNT 1-94 [Tanacetum coccineum]
MRKKVDSRYVLENVLIGCGGAYVGMKGTKGGGEGLDGGDGFQWRRGGGNVGVVWVRVIGYLIGDDKNPNRWCRAFFKMDIGSTAYENDIPETYHNAIRIPRVAFQKHSCFVRDLDGVDLLKGSRGTNLYTISLEDMIKSSPTCLLSKVSKTKSRLWHCRLSYLNFGTINQLAKGGLVRCLPKLKYEKYHLCSVCSLGKSKKQSHKPKSENSIQEKLYLLHMDLCRPMRVESINGKKYILVIVDDYSRFTWVKFLRSKDENSEFVIKFLKKVQVALNATVRYIRTDNGTEFVNQTLRSYYEDVGITHQTSVARTPEQSGVVESEDLGKLKPKADIGIFIGYSPVKKAYRIYNKRTRLTMDNIHVEFDELVVMASEQFSSGPAPQLLTPGCISSGLVQNPSSSTPYVPPSKKDWDILFQPFFDEYFPAPTKCCITMLPAAVPIPADITSTPSSTTIDQDALFASTSPTIEEIQAPVIHQDPISKESSSKDVIPSNLHQVNQPFDHLKKWTKDHPLDNFIGNPS